MRYVFSDPEYWRDVSPIKGILLAALLILANSFILANIAGNIQSSNAGVLDFVFGPLILLVYYWEVYAMVRGVMMRKGFK